MKTWRRVGVAVTAAAMVAAGALAAATRAPGVGGSDGRRGDGPTIRMPGSIVGKVIHVADGDTLTILDEEGFKRTIRLTDIDAPESSHGASRPGQPYSAKATAHLQSLVLGRPAQATCYDIDARKRDDGSMREGYVCRVVSDGQDANHAMLDAGLAMVYRLNMRFVRDASSVLHEEAARKARKGLWAQDSPVPPWQWRRMRWGQHQCAAVAE